MHKQGPQEPDLSDDGYGQDHSRTYVARLACGRVGESVVKWVKGGVGAGSEPAKR